MKKVLFLIPNLGAGGAEKVLVNLANNMDKCKYDVTIQTLFDIGENRELLSKEIKYIPGWKKQIRGYSKLQRIIPQRVLAKIIINEEYDYIISFLEDVVTRIIGGIKSEKIKKIAWVHTEMLSHKQFSRCYRSFQEAKKTYESMDYVVAVSEQIKDSLEKIVKTDRIIVKYNVIESDVIIEKAKTKPSDMENNHDVTICSIGRLMPVKGFDRLLEAHKRLIDEGLSHRIYIIGKGQEFKSLQKQAEVLGVADSFRIIGYRSNPYCYISNSDLYVCSSRREGFSTAITEALIIGTPVVSTNCSGARELLGENNEFGLVVENSTEGIYIGVKQMLENPQLLKYYKKQAKARGCCFSKEKIVQAVEEMLESL